jgi:hypothetical protein
MSSQVKRVLGLGSGNRYQSLLKNLTTRWNSEAQKDYLQHRYCERLQTAYSTSYKARTWYTRGRWVTVALASMAPTFVTLSTQVTGRAAGYLKGIAIIMSVLVALATAALAAFRADDYWSVNHHLRSELESVGWKAAGQNGGDGFDTFVQEVEDCLTTFESNYQARIAAAQST